jgi:hypothetical protein
MVAQRSALLIMSYTVSDAMLAATIASISTPVRSSASTDAVTRSTPRDASGSKSSTALVV